MAAVSLNSLVGFNSTKFPAKYQHASGSSVVTSAMKAARLAYPLRMFELRRPMVTKRWGLCLSVADGDQLTTDTSKGSGTDESSLSNDRVSTVNSTSLDSAPGDSLFQTDVDDGTGFQNSGVSNGPTVSSDKEEMLSSPNMQSTPKKSMLTARERLRAARVLSRYTETKEPKAQLGSKVLDALRESDRGKNRSGLPEAPGNLFDDSKRGMPKKGLTFDFPGGFDLFLIAFSFVFISTVMFATTFIVWKVGAIHFNEY